MTTDKLAFLRKTCGTEFFVQDVDQVGGVDPLGLDEFVRDEEVVDNDVQALFDASDQASGTAAARDGDKPTLKPPARRKKTHGNAKFKRKSKGASSNSSKRGRTVHKEKVKKPEGCEKKLRCSNCKVAGRTGKESYGHNFKTCPHPIEILD